MTELDIALMLSFSSIQQEIGVNSALVNKKPSVILHQCLRVRFLRIVCGKIVCRWSQPGPDLISRYSDPTLYFLTSDTVPTSDTILTSDTIPTPDKSSAMALR